MLLTIETTGARAEDLSYLLHKHPARLQTFEQSFGHAYVFYPVNEPTHCRVALLLEVDPIELVRRRGGPSAFALGQYVNDRPYCASSLLSVAIADVFGTAMNGRCKERPEAVDRPLWLRTTFAALPCRGGAERIRDLFEPLGYGVDIQSSDLDSEFPEWGTASSFVVTLERTCLLRELLAHIYVLIPVLDNEKHYWVGPDEVEKLLSRGEGWLALHPHRDSIVQSYLRYKRGLTRNALGHLLAEAAEEEGNSEECECPEDFLEQPIRLSEQRLGHVLAALKASGASRVVDLGCGSGKLLRLLLEEPSFQEIVGMDVSHRAIEIAARHLRLDHLHEKQRSRITLLHGSLLYRDARLEGFDAAALVEVIEHLDPPRLAVMERVVFALARPGNVVVTTPNFEFNCKFPNLQPGGFRHPDHRFEWTRAEFRAWTERISSLFDYTAKILPIGPEDPQSGAPTQMAVFTRTDKP